MEDSYQTIAKHVSVETKVKGSRFIGEALQVESVEFAQSKLDEIRKREHSATHHCFAYQIGLGSNVEFRYSDDGEPNGTAGKPIYDCLAGKKLTNTLLVVTRYFGGTKLGTGGLARAYSDCAKQTLKNAKIKTVYLTNSLELKFDFKFYDVIQRLLNKYGASQKESEFSQQVHLLVLIRKSRTDDFVKELTNLTAGQTEIGNEQQ
jgi:uncharacterized YigZ family protein